MKILWTCARCGTQAVTERQPNTLTNERCNIPRGWMYWLSKAYCPTHHHDGLVEPPPLDLRRPE